jgi:hypothetical protein
MVFEVLFWYFAEASASAVATVRMRYVTTANAEEKAADLQRRLNEALKVVREKSAAASKWQ